MSEPTREELIKCAATYLQGNWDDADRECIAFFIERWLKDNNLIAVQVPERPGSSFTKTEIQQAKTK